MRERPILFSAPMVCAILEDRKTQTRRIVKPLPPLETTAMVNFADDEWACVGNNGPNRRCPYGVAGDRLWVRETFWFSEYSSPHPKPTKEAIGEGWGVCYAADRPSEHDILRPVPGTLERLRPSIHMPRWASRITLEITGVRVERLQEISDEDAWAEGCKRGLPTDNGGYFPAEEPHPKGGDIGWDCALDWYADLWDSINGEGAWELNPWVWVMEFRRLSTINSQLSTASL